MQRQTFLAISDFCQTTKKPNKTLPAGVDRRIEVLPRGRVGEEERGLVRRGLFGLDTRHEGPASRRVTRAALSVATSELLRIYLFYDIYHNLLFRQHLPIYFTTCFLVQDSHRIVKRSRLFWFKKPKRRNLSSNKSSNKFFNLIGCIQIY